jgi:hypothetical protein
MIDQIIKNNVRVINRFSAIDEIPVVFIHPETSFNGFFDTPEDAAAAAVAQGHTPFIIYEIPATVKYSYRRVYTLDSDCSVFPGPQRRMERLIQGG